MPDPTNPVLFFPFFVAFFSAICFALSLISGWRSLAEHYKATQPFSGERWHLRSGSMGLVSYGSCLTLGANTEGIFLSVLFPFRVGHPPLFIPWSEVQSAEHCRWFFFPMVRFQFRKVPSVSFKIYRGLALAVAKEAHGRLALAGS